MLKEILGRFTKKPAAEIPENDRMSIIHLHIEGAVITVIADHQTKTYTAESDNPITNLHKMQVHKLLCKLLNAGPGAVKEEIKI